jgi:arginase family enzyme
MPTAPVLLGVPYDASSSFLRGAADAPPLIREALRSPAGNSWSERLVNVESPEAFEDRGDLDLPPAVEALEHIERAFASVAESGRPFLALGGDHAVTHAILRGARPGSTSLTVVQVDAHPDLYDSFEGRH